MSYSILVVEDDIYILELIKEFLEAQEYLIEVAAEGLEDWKKFSEGNFDLIILDIMILNIDGFSLCNMIRKKSSVPIIVLTALNEEKDQIKAFEHEADDFISKPFSFNILSKRVRAVREVLKRPGCPYVNTLTEVLQKQNRKK